LKLANSAYFSFRYEVKTISHAITLLGLNLVKSLAIGVSVFESFSKGLREEIAFISQLWMHSIGVGMMSQEIWLKRGNRTESEFALLCGLLHDLGKILYFKKDAVGYGRQFGRKKGDQDPDISALELECYGVDHATLGALIAKQWRLPPELATVVQHHHSSFTQSRLVAAVSVADMLAKQTGIGYDGDRKIREDLADMQAMLQMNSQEYDRLVEMAESKRVEVEAFFQLNP
jgi:putative nucleotidyltransferase with HDIG domain